MAERLLELVARVIALLPWRALPWFGAPLGWAVGSGWRVRRTHVQSEMRRAGVPRPRHTARAMYRSLGVGLFELLWTLGRPGRELGSVARISPRLRALLADHDQRPLILATAHTGNWDLSACALARAGYPLTIVSKRLRMGGLDRFWQAARAREGVELVHGAGTFEQIGAALARRRHVALIIDQAPERESAVTLAAFLGKTARCDTTAALLAARTGASVALVLGHRASDGVHEIDVHLVLPPPERRDRAWINASTAALQRELEVFVRCWPEQWLWLHRRWKGVAHNDPPGLATLTWPRAGSKLV